MASKFSSKSHITVTRAQPGSRIKSGMEKNRGLLHDLIRGQHGASIPSDGVLTFHYYLTLQHLNKYFTVWYAWSTYFGTYFVESCTANTQSPSSSNE